MKLSKNKTNINKYSKDIRRIFYYHLNNCILNEEFLDLSLQRHSMHQLFIFILHARICLSTEMTKVTY